MIGPPSVVDAVFASAATGAGVIGVAFALSIVAPTILEGGIPPGELPYALANLVLFTGYALFCAFLVFCVGLGLIGLPAWFVLHRMGRRSRTDAAIAGGALSAIPTAALITAAGGLSDPSALMSGLVVTGAGIVAGLAFRRAAYGPAGRP